MDTGGVAQEEMMHRVDREGSAMHPMHQSSLTSMTLLLSRAFS